MRPARLVLGLVAAWAAACAHRPLHLAAEVGAEVEAVAPRRYRLHLAAPDRVPFETALAVAADVSLSAGFRYFRLIDEAAPGGTRIIAHTQDFLGGPGLRSYQLGRTTLFECVHDGASFQDTFSAPAALRSVTAPRSAAPPPPPSSPLPNR
jgi:hypothetical protein